MGRKKKNQPLESPPPTTTSVRADKWLWAARCFKTRSQATEACNNGLCKVNGRIIKPSHSIRVGDLVEAECPGRLRILLVEALAERRGSASAAAELFEDRSPEPERRPPPEPELGGIAPERRPTKHQRKQLRKLRGY